MRVLVTGATGFVGYAVTCELIAAGHKVVALARQPRSGPVPRGVTGTLAVDVRDEHRLVEALTGTPIDGICHLAALAQVRASLSNPLAYWETNLGGTINLLQALAKTQDRPLPIVFASTAAIYGRDATGALTEQTPAHPDTPYAATKYAAEQLLESVATTNAIGVTTLRCFGIAGACNSVGDNDTTRIIPNAIRAATGEIDALHINGDGTAQREYTHVRDVADAARRALETTSPSDARLYNVGTGHGISVAEIVQTVTQTSGREIPIQRMPEQPEPQQLVASGNLIRTDLGWTPHRSDITTIIRDAWAARALPPTRHN